MHSPLLETTPPPPPRKTVDVELVRFRLPMDAEVLGHILKQFVDTCSGYMYRYMRCRGYEEDGVRYLLVTHKVAEKDQSSSACGDGRTSMRSTNSEPTTS